MPLLELQLNSFSRLYSRQGNWWTDQPGGCTLGGDCAGKHGAGHVLPGEGTRSISGRRFSDFPEAVVGVPIAPAGFEVFGENHLLSSGNRYERKVECPSEQHNTMFHDFLL